jgi:serine/threonine protein kinase
MLLGHIGAHPAGQKGISMDRSPDWGRIETNAGNRLRDIAARFQKAWQKITGPPDPVGFDAYLPARDDPLRPLALHALIKIDLENRWQRGQPTRLDHYLERFPELGPARNLPAQLIWEEYRIRHEHGDKPPLSAYLSRFPEQFAELQRLIENEKQRGQRSLTMSAPELPRTVASTPTDLLRVTGGYRLLKVIGQGTFGQVFQAEAPGGVEVAIKKIMRPLSHKDVQRELQALEVIKRLRHPFLLQTQAYWSRQDELLIVMELADGSLSNRLEACHRAGQAGIPVEELLQYFREAAEALDYLHTEQVLHRDIKPQNILLLKGHAKVADFGLARMWDGDDALQATSCGTPAFMAPEVWKGNVNPHSDQYSLAATYFTLRVGRLLFAGNLNAIFEHLEQEPDLNPLPEPEQQVLRKALAKKPADRYATCREFIQALTQAVLSGGAARPPTVPEGDSGDGPASLWQSLPTNSSKPTPLLVEEPPVQPPTRPPRRRVVVLGAVALAAVAGALIGFAAWYINRPDRHPDTGPVATDTHVPVPNTRPGTNGEEKPLREAPGPDYVLKYILVDVRSLPAEARPFVRYFSLDHLRAIGATPKELAQHRDALTEVVAYLSRDKGAGALREIDPAHTVFRVDLRTLRWDRQPFQIMDDEKPVGASSVNLFDLALLEYPYATIAENSASYAQLAKEFLKPAGQVRPIVYVRADWFISVATQPPLAEDFLLHQPAGRPLNHALLAPVTRRFAEPVGLATACAELGVPESDDLKRKFAPLADHALARLAAGDVVSRKTWENAFGPMVDQLGLGTPILPLDALTVVSFQPVPTIDVELGTNKESNEFYPGDEIQLLARNRSQKDVNIEVILANSEGGRFIQPMTPARVEPLQEAHSPKGKVEEGEGKEQITLFASHAPLPAGQRLHGDGVADRIVHPFYQSQPVEAVKIAKVTREIKTLKRRD